MKVKCREQPRQWIDLVSFSSGKVFVEHQMLKRLGGAFERYMCKE
jgi:hypothetical protein